jgi:hypothetical protein
MTFGQAWTQVRSRLLPLVGLALLVLVVVAGTFLLATVAGVAVIALTGGIGALAGVPLIMAGAAAAVWLYVRLSLAPCALVLERTGIGASLRRSIVLVRGDWWRVFGILLLTVVIGTFVSQVVQLPFAALGAGSVGGVFDPATDVLGDPLPGHVGHRQRSGRDAGRTVHRRRAGPALRRPPHPRRGPRRLAVRGGRVPHVTPSGLLALVVDREAAREAAERELRRQEYVDAQPSPVTRLVGRVLREVGELLARAAEVAPRRGGSGCWRCWPSWRCSSRSSWPGWVRWRARPVRPRCSPAPPP